MQVLPTQGCCCPTSSAASGSSVNNALSGETIPDAVNVVIPTGFTVFMSIALGEAGTYLISATAGVLAALDAFLNSGVSHLIGDLYDGAIPIASTDRAIACYSENYEELTWTNRRISIITPSTISVRIKRDVSVTDFPTVFVGAYSNLSYIKVA